MSFFDSQLFKDVQMQHVFSDCKTFADAIARVNWQSACKSYEQLAPLTNTQLSEFVNAHFITSPVLAMGTEADTSSVKHYIDSLWNGLRREADTPKQDSLLALKHSYIVPGGRFQEIYYWDSYFTALGLIDADKGDVVEDMLLNFVDLINDYGCIPNGNRRYYLSRSQPPVLALMVELLWEHTHSKSLNTQWLAMCVAALEKEYIFWMQGAQLLSTHVLSSKRVVRMPCGGILNRYWDDVSEPRAESLREDLALAEGLAKEKNSDFYRNIRAACESGWDFSSRWLGESNLLSSIQTTDIVPIDLNCLMYNLENQLSKFFQLLGNSEQAEHYQLLASNRKALINAYLWNEPTGFFVDYNCRTTTQSPILSAAATTALFVNLASNEQAIKVATRLADKFLKEGGIVTTITQTAQQWDSPNGWAPLQWFAVKGLNNYGITQLSTHIMKNWVNMVEQNFAANKCLLEKYNVCTPAVLASGGEYQVQQGFGWTNGVTARFYTLLNNPEF
ncbi:trehalase family glycosidase [Pseudoalteromonas sp. BSi20495]|uniref:trehalase family glycosidase n=1 Tax=Pseudoalteromonas sp. BSi20495 TaxID=386429 RepID=UPI0002315879|nr:trehalase family glycosidase [Pseudoalteromonas sp. BSi20495]GAA78148.1 alpha,alpha-trehalase [Pseudoalteromonas sp. BSi20495]